MTGRPPAGARTCFAALVRAHPTAFRLVAQGARFRILEVLARR
jgi:hypothetical protein